MGLLISINFNLLIMNFFTVQILEAAMLMMLYACAVPLSEERRREGSEMLRGTETEMQRGTETEMQRGTETEMQRGEGGGREGGYDMQRRGGGKGIVGCDLDNKLQEGGWLELLDEC